MNIFKFDTIFDKIQKHIRQKQYKMQTGDFNAPTGIFWFISILLIVIWFASGVRIIGMQQLGVVLRFGEAVRVIEPGLHYCLPYPIERTIIVDATSVRRIDSTREQDSTLVLTGDENIANIHFYVLWNVKDPINFLFSAKTPENTIRAAANSIVREIIAQNQFENILTVGRDSIAQKAQSELQKFIDKCNLGVQIVEVQLGKIDPPAEKVILRENDELKEESVIDAYREVQTAKADYERSVNDSESYENYIIPTSRGQAEKIVKIAESYQIDVLAKAKGDSKQFKLLSQIYKQKPDIIKAHLLMEYKQKILKNANQIIIGNNRSNMPVLNFKSLVQKADD